MNRPAVCLLYRDTGGRDIGNMPEESPITVDLKMEVGGGGIPRRSHCSDEAPGTYGLAAMNEDEIQMAVNGIDFFGGFREMMFDNDGIAEIIVLLFYTVYNPSCDSMDWSPCRHLEVDPGMIGGDVFMRIKVIGPEVSRRIEEFHCE